MKTVKATRMRFAAGRRKMLRNKKRLSAEERAQWKIKLLHVTTIVGIAKRCATQVLNNVLSPAFVSGQPVDVKELEREIAYELRSHIMIGGRK